MKLSVTAVALHAGLAIGAAVPDAASQQEPLNQDNLPTENILLGSPHKDAWWNHLVSADAVKSAYAEATEAAKSAVDMSVSALREMEEKATEELSKLHHAKGGDKKQKHTAYEVIWSLPHTRKFAKLVSEYSDLVDLLNSTDSESEYTVFAPHDDAFEHIPDDHEKPDKDTIKKVLQYHIGDGKFKAKDVATKYTLPTILKESWLGGEEQRLRTGWGLKGININFYAKVVGADFEGTNGVVHVVNHFLVPPPMVGVILSLFPAEFSTLLLAYEKTDFVKFVHSQKMIGSTVFAPSNKAFKSLGPKANAFLFNTDHGKKYLSAILKYNIVPNATLYSDAFYDKRDSKDEAEDKAGQDHYDLTTLLPNANLGVDVGHFLGFSFIRVNGFTDVVIHDAIARNGALHVVNNIVLPPHKGKHTQTADISVESLKECLGDYVGEDSDDYYWSEL